MAGGSLSSAAGVALPLGVTRFPALQHQVLQQLGRQQVPPQLAPELLPLQTAAPMVVSAPPGVADFSLESQQLILDLLGHPQGPTQLLQGQQLAPQQLAPQQQQQWQQAAQLQQAVQLQQAAQLQQQWQQAALLQQQQWQQNPQMVPQQMPAGGNRHQCCVLPA